MTTVLVFAVPFVVILVLAAAALRQVFGDTMRSRIITLGVLLAVLRIGSLWFLQYHAWTRTESLSYLPLALLLMPEALLAQRLFTLGSGATVASVLGFSLLLAGGSFLAAVAFGRLERRLVSDKAAAIALLAALAGCGERNTYTAIASPAVAFAAHVAEDKPTAEAAIASTAANGELVYLHPKAELASADIARTGVRESSGTTWGVTIDLTPQGAAKLSRVSTASQGKLLALVLNGQVACAPRMHARLGGTVVVEGGWSEDEARGIAKGLAGRP
jgi:hypothetical protein